MADRVSPLAGHIAPGDHVDRPVDPGVVLAERPIAALVQVCAWPGTVDRVAGVIASVAGCPVAPNQGGSSAGGGAAILNLAPGRWLVDADDPRLARHLAERIDADLGTVTDLGHARVVVSVAGPKAGWVLSKGLPLDLDPAAEPPLDVAQSAIDGIAVIVRRRAADRFDLYVYRGFALSLWSWLTDAAAETGWRAATPGGDRD